mgnify:CR=1 FL=1
MDKPITIIEDTLDKLDKKQIGERIMSIIKDNPDLIKLDWNDLYLVLSNIEEFKQYQECANGLIKYIGIGNKNIDYLLYTPLLRNIINNSFKFTDNNFIDENDLFISFCYSEVGIAKSILKNMNIDLFKIFKL